MSERYAVKRGNRSNMQRVPEGDQEGTTGHIIGRGKKGLYVCIGLYTFYFSTNMHGFPHIMTSTIASTVWSNC